MSEGQEGQELTPADIPRKHRSVSQMTTWLKCGEQYRLQKVAKAPEYPAAWLAGGSAFHTVCERWEKGDRTESLATMVDLFVSEYDRLIAEDMERCPNLDLWGKAGRYKPEAYIAKLRADGPGWVDGYMRHALAAPWRFYELPDGSPAIEVPFTLDLGTVLIRGYIDQILVYPDGSILVRDLKSGSKKPANNLQLGTYRIAVQDLFGDLPGFGDFFMAKEGRPTMAADLGVWSEDLLRAMYWGLERAIDSEVFIPNPSDDTCRPCGVRRFCRIMGEPPEISRFS